MKRVIAVCLLILLAVPVFGGTLFAVEDSSSTEQTASEKEAETNDAVSLRERWEKRKKQFGTELTYYEKTQLKLRCKPAQTGQIQKVGGRLNGIQTSREKVHSNMVNHLNSLIPKLEVAGLDTTTLSSQIEMLKTKIETFNTDFSTYEQAVADMEAIDCAAEPDGFQASLEDARASLEKLKTDAKDIRTYVKETIRKELVNLHKLLGSESEIE